MQHFVEDWYSIIDTNFQIQGGEIDIIMEKDGWLFFVEVKVVDGLDELVGHITKGKIAALRRSIDQFVYRKHLKPATMRLLFVYVKNYRIYSIHEFE